MRAYSPAKINLNSFHTKPPLLRCLLIPHFQAPDLVEYIRWERQVVVALRLLVHVLHDHIDGLPNVSLFQIGVPDQVRILKHLGRVEIANRGDS